MEEPWWRLSGRINFELKDYATAVESLIQIRYVRQLDRAYMAASFAFLGRDAEATLTAESIIEAEPGFKVATFINAQPYVTNEIRVHLANGLAKAGLG